MLAFDGEAATGCGQARAFVLDLRRLANLSLTASWFLRLSEQKAGVLGRAPKALRERVNAAVTELARRRPETLTRSEPLWEAGG